MSENTILLFGGESNERLVSVASAQNLAKHLYNPTCWFWHLDGSIFPIEVNDLLGHKNPFTTEFIPKCSPIFSSIEDAIASSQCDKKVFVLALHGGAGENGQLQAILEKYDRIYTGSDSKSSQIAFNKLLSKKYLKDCSINLAPDQEVFNNDPESDQKVIKEFFASHGECIVKPNEGGSSIGCAFIRSEKDFDHAFLQLKKNCGQKYLVEKVIRGREFTNAVFESNSQINFLPVTEIKTSDAHEFDYQGKYLGIGTKEITPADINQELSKRIQKITATAHKELGLFGYSRSDVIFDGEKIFLLESNTLPGMSAASLVPQQLAEAKISMKDFLQNQIELAIKRHRSR